jgi:hypothetical protein
MPPSYDNADSVSCYFTTTNSHEAYLDVRNLDHFDNIKNDPIFVEFPDEYELVPLDDVVKVRDRDEEFEEEPKEEGEIGANDPEIEIVERASPASSQHDEQPATKPHNGDDQEDILAMLGVTGMAKPVKPTPGPAYAPPSGGASWSPPKSAGSEYREKGRYDSGPHRSSSPVKSERKYSYGDRRESYDDHRSYDDRKPYFNGRKSSHGDYRHYNDQHRPSSGGRGQSYEGRRPSYGKQGPSVPPPPPVPHSPDAWEANRGRYSPARSDRSGGTAPGSDFGPPDTTAGASNGNSNKEDMDMDHDRPSLHRSDTSASRKRHHDSSESGDEMHRQTDDATPKTKRRAPNVSSAYSRR